MTHCFLVSFSAHLGILAGSYALPGLPLVDVRARSYAASTLGPECLTGGAGGTRATRATMLLVLPLSEGLSLWPSVLDAVPKIFG